MRASKLLRRAEAYGANAARSGRTRARTLSFARLAEEGARSAEGARRGEAHRSDCPHPVLSRRRERENGARGQAQVDRARVRFEPLGAREHRGFRTDRGDAGRVGLDHVDATQEAVDADAADRAREAERGQHVVRAGTVVAEGFRRVVAEEDAAGTAEPRQQRARLARGHDQVLGCVALGHLDRLGQVAHADQARVRERGGGGVASRQGFQLLRHGDLDRGDQLGTGTDQQHLRIGAVLGLREQVGGDEGGVGAVVGDDQHFGRSGRHVDRRTARIGRDFELGQRDPGVAGAEQLVAAGHRFAAVGKRGDRLRAAELEHARHAAQFRGDQDRRIGAAVGARRRRQHDVRAAGQTRRNRQHPHGRGQRRAAGRRVQADAADRAHDLLAAHAGRGVHAQVARQLGGVERLHARYRAAHRFAHLGLDFRLGRGEFVRTDLE